MAKIFNKFYMEQERKYSASNYHPLPVVLTRGKGVWVWDVEGQKYLDMVSAYSALSHGHRHPALYKALCEQAKKLALTSRAFHTDQLGPFMKKICALSGMEMGLVMNTGAEAVETAIKGVRRWGYRVKKIPENQAQIIVAHQNFHGRTTTLVGFSSEEEYRKDFGPFGKGFVSIPFGDIKALKKAITPHTCAFLIEPMQGEAGIILPPAGWLQEVAEVCKAHNVLLILDEIQTGLGRTGKMFAFQHESIKPDGLILGKALGGGLLPVSVFLGRREILELFTPGSHGSTFGGNPLAMAVAQEALKVLEEEHLAERSAELGSYFLEQLQTCQSPLIREVRGKGLWIGVDFNPTLILAREVSERMMRDGILCKDTHETVVRFAPPLIIQKKELDWTIQIFKKVLGELEKELKKAKKL